MTLPFKLIRNPFNRNQKIPVHVGDDADVMFEKSYPDMPDQPVGLWQDDWNERKWSTTKTLINQDFVVVTPLDTKFAELSDDNKLAAPQSLKNRPELES